MDKLLKWNYIDRCILINFKRFVRSEWIRHGGNVLPNVGIVIFQ